MWACTYIWLCVYLIFWGFNSDKINESQDKHLTGKVWAAPPGPELTDSPGDRKQDSRQKTDRPSKPTLFSPSSRKRKRGKPALTGYPGCSAPPVLLFGLEQVQSVLPRSGAGAWPPGWLLCTCPRNAHLVFPSCPTHTQGSKSYPRGRPSQGPPWSRSSTIIIYIYFLLKYSWFTVLCQYLLCSRVTQLYPYRHSFAYSFPLWFTTGYWVQFPVLYSRTLLFIHSKCNRLHLPTPNSQSIPLPHLLPLGNHKSVLCVCESVSVL